MTVRAALRGTAISVVAGTLLCGCNLGRLQNAVLVDTDSTSGTTQTLSPFGVSGPWQMNYTFDCSKANSEGAIGSNAFSLDVFNGDDNSLAYEHPQTTLVAVKRKGTLSFATPGNYYLRVDTQCEWTLQVVDRSGGAPASASPAPELRRPSGAVKLDVTFAADLGAYTCGLTGTAAQTCLVADGTAGASPFGPLSMHLLVALRGTGRCLTAAITGTLTAAGGDVLDVKSDNAQACPQSPTNTYTVTVGGGTGIFSTATGSLTVSDHQGTSDRWTGSISFAR